MIYWRLLSARDFFGGESDGHAICRTGPSRRRRSPPGAWRAVVRPADRADGTRHVGQWPAATTVFPSGSIDFLRTIVSAVKTRSSLPLRTPTVNTYDRPYGRARCVRRHSRPWTRKPPRRVVSPSTAAPGFPLAVPVRRTAPATRSCVLTPTANRVNTGYGRSANERRLEPPVFRSRAARIGVAQSSFLPRERRKHGRGGQTRIRIGRPRKTKIPMTVI